MARFRILGSLVVVAVTTAILGILANFAFENELLTGWDYQVAAAASLGFVLLVLVVFASVGRPWHRWKRTSYW